MKKGILLAAMACVAMFALPAVASAGTWHVQNGTIGFSGSGPEGQLTTVGGTGVKCASVAVNGAYENTTTGWVKFTFHGCFAQTFFNPHCQSAGQPTGTITTTKLTFHNVLADRNTGGGIIDKNWPAILITGKPTVPPGETDHFASFACFGITTVVKGNGLIGVLDNKCGDKAPGTTVTFNSSSTGVPEPTQVTGTGTQYTLTSTTSGTSRMASEDASGSLNFTEGAEQTIECT